jgi:hypothetical protein
MKLACTAIGVVLIISLAVVPALRALPLQRSVSPSRQFIVYGLTVPLRGAMGALAEKTKSSLLAILQKRDQWKTPIILNLQPPQANVPDMPAAQLHVSQTGMGLKLQLDLIIGAKVDTLAIQRELLRAILIELIYREHSDVPAGTMYAEAPAWLVEGVLAWNSSDSKETLNSLLTSAAESHQIIPLDVFLRQKPEQLDAQGRLLYRAYAAALLQLLLDQPTGPARLSAYIQSLSQGTNDPLFDLKSQFPALSSGDALDALWTSAVARFAASIRYEFLLGFGETNEQLENLLHTKIPNPGSGSQPLELPKLGRTKPTAAQIPALRSLGQSLLLLGASSHPLLRPVVGEYQQIAQLLAARKPGKTVQRLARVKSLREDIVRRMTDIDDYMNWFEATQLQTSSGDFGDYLKAARESGEPEKRRRDALSVYLDAVETQFQN